MQQRAVSGKKRIVIIDDDPDVLFLYKTRLEIKGYDVIGESCPDEARWVIRENMPDLIILDLIMPGVTGFDLLISLPYEFGPRKIPVVVMTATEDPGMHVQALRLGAAAVLRKGRDDLNLLMKVDELLANGCLNESGATADE